MPDPIREAPTDVAGFAGMGAPSPGATPRIGQWTAGRRPFD